MQILQSRGFGDLLEWQEHQRKGLQTAGLISLRSGEDASELGLDDVDDAADSIEAWFIAKINSWNWFNGSDKNGFINSGFNGTAGCLKASKVLGDSSRSRLAQCSKMALEDDGIKGFIVGNEYTNGRFRESN